MWLNSKAINFMKNLSYSLASNLISLSISTLIVLIVPKMIGVKEYGYLQLYLFYSAYVGFMHLGWNDGIYLRYGGKDYKDLDKRLLFSQFYMMVIFQLCVAFIVFLGSMLVLKDNNRIYIFQMISLNLFIMNILTMLLFILQATNRIKEYAKSLMYGRLFYILIVTIFLLNGIRDFKIIIFSDLIGYLISLLIAIKYCKDFIFLKASSFYISFKEALENISVGMKLLLANIASMLIIGVVRFGIERTWDVSTFGKVSLILSVTNLMIFFINAIGIIVFPILRKAKKTNLPLIYTTIRNFLMVILIGLLLAYYPLKVILTLWLPNYADNLIYMVLLFPIFIYEGKMVLLLNTYLKTLREEKLLLKINLLTLALSIAITMINTIIFKNLTFAILSIVVFVAFKSVVAELYISKVLQIKIYRDIFLELAITFFFIITGWFISNMIAPILFIVVYITYLTIKSKDIVNSFNNFKLLLKTS